MTISKINQTKEHLIRCMEVHAKTGLGASSIYAMMKNGEFPFCPNLSERRVAWIEYGVNQWIANCVAQHKPIQEVMP